ncbi:hypothetical protein Taro_000665 [Colocasia esculenta]|uniref:Uncharacterized protein n=1 Tax=Colocasia esculenta TaxID=4460 RepID=A0A843TFW8_COLES|nr:hypothetical protein [Colocasia esculenta]
MGMEEVCSSSSLSNFSSHRQVVVEEYRSSKEEAGPMWFGHVVCAGVVQVLKDAWRTVERVAVTNRARKRRGVVQFPWEFAEGSPSVVVRRLFRNASLVGYPRFFVSQARVFVVLRVLSRYWCCTVEVCVVFLDTLTPMFELYVRLRERRQWGSDFPEFVL